PYFLLDLAPQGFLGRKIAQELSSQSEDFPSDPRHWNGNHIGRYLISNGDDLPGNFKFGQQALDRVRRKLEIVSDEEYPQLADDVMSGVIPGSSAGGEQPKFTAFSAHRSAHVIVKFAPRGDNAIARRWRDILITEHHATEALHKYEIPAAETRLLEVDGMLFLESERFDRSSQHGRLPMVSLQAVDAEFVGMGSNWLRVLTELHKKKLVNDEPVYDAELYWRFGRCINNSDMHLGNISLAIAGDVFKLLPIYDMCSMGFAPKSGGEIPPLDFIPTETNWGFCEGAKCIELHKLAHNFWDNVANDPRISDEFKAYLELGNPIDRMQQG
ncbi:MAG: HipA domain-containing protein, partial [Desulfuromonadales bacterium]|nr:HipA domain-containing protein [Desulfuromonadales bacterium]